jgi:hypothetical protein
MKVIGLCDAQPVLRKRCFYIKPVVSDYSAFQNFFEKKALKEERNGRAYFPKVTLHIQAEHRTFKQNNTLWALISLLFEYNEGRKPLEEEKYDLYLDILDAYADRVPNKLTGKPRPLHISESDTVHGAKLIQAVFDILAGMLDMEDTLQADVKDLFWEWEKWRADLEEDPLDNLTEQEWLESHKVSQASGIGGALEKAHIVSRGADESAIDEPFNWLLLTHEEHIEIQHKKGWKVFLMMFPHLEGRVRRARRLAFKKYGVKG